MPTLQDARAREQDARERAHHAIQGYASSPPHLLIMRGFAVFAALDAYATAIEARVRCELAEGVRKLDGWELDRGRGWDCSCDMKREPFASYYDPDFVRTADVLRLLGETER